MKQEQRGLTLIELVVVMAVLALMAGILVPLLESFVRLDGAQREKDQLRQVQKAVEAFYRDRILREGLLPTTAVRFSDWSSTKWEKASLVPKDILEGDGPGYCCLDSWFEKDVQMPEKDTTVTLANLLDVWGRTVVIGPGNKDVLNGDPWIGVLLPIKRIVSYGPDHTQDLPGKPANDLSVDVLVRPFLVAAGEDRIRSINGMLAVYNQNIFESAGIWNFPAQTGPIQVENPFIWARYDDPNGAGPGEALNDLRLAGLINDSKVWESDPDFLGLDFVDADGIAPEKFLHVAYRSLLDPGGGGIVKKGP